MTPENGRNPKGLIKNRPELRKHDCAYASDCLNDIITEPWQGMSCANCTAYRPMTYLENRRDVEGIAELFSAMNGHESRERLYSLSGPSMYQRRTGLMEAIAERGNKISADAENPAPEEEQPTPVVTSPSPPKPKPEPKAKTANGHTRKPSKEKPLWYLRWRRARAAN